MLDREEEQRLAEIEARLRADDPALHELFAKAAAGPAGVLPEAPPERPDASAEPEPDLVVRPDAPPTDSGAPGVSTSTASPTSSNGADELDLTDDPTADRPEVDGPSARDDRQGPADPHPPVTLPPAPPDPTAAPSTNPYLIDPVDWVQQPGRRWYRGHAGHPSTTPPSATPPPDGPRRRWDDLEDGEAEVKPPPGLLSAIVRTFVALITAIVVTAGVTVVFGPDVGGFVAVVVFCVAGMYGYQTLRGCPGLRRARGQD